MQIEIRCEGKVEGKPCAKTFRTEIDKSAHMLFYHGISIAYSNEVREGVKEDLKRQYNNARTQLNKSADISNLLSKQYSEYIEKKRKPHKPINSDFNKKSKKMWVDYLAADKKTQKNVYRLNGVVKNIESYGLREEEFV